MSTNKQEGKGNFFTIFFSVAASSDLILFVWVKRIY